MLTDTGVAIFLPLRDEDSEAERGTAMKAVVMKEYGGPEVLEYSDFPDPSPGPGEVLVRVAAASINPVDLKQRAGDTKAYFPLQFPNVIGWDVSGTVAKLGPGVARFSVGDRVFAWAFHTYAELCVVKAGILAKIPEEIDLVEAAALPLVTMTGSQLISMASGVKQGQMILISGALGSVARAAVCTAKDKGAVVIAGVRKDQLPDANELGANEVVALDAVADFQALSQVDVVANTVGGTTAEQLLGKVKDGGTFASVTGVPDKAKAYPSVHVVAFVSKQDPQTLLYMANAVRDGRLKIPIVKKMPLKDARQGHIDMAKGVAGKILLVA
jgi:NADPH:quinone reductase-like Zn-dependent oxidoreductase